nr:uncharacterized protein LOC128693422 [Cherax quadricarinatus]
MRKQCPVDLPRSPLKIWINEDRKLPYEEAMTCKEWKQKFQNLEKEDKLKHIITSLREFYEYKKSADEYLEKNPDFVFPIIQGPKKSDIQLFPEGVILFHFVYVLIIYMGTLSCSIIYMGTLSCSIIYMGTLSCSINLLQMYPNPKLSAQNHKIRFYDSLAIKISSVIA